MIYHTEENFNAVIALMDILGYKNMIEKMNLDKLADLILNTLSNTISGCNQFLQRDLERFKKFSDYSGEIIPLKWIQISDTILLYLRCDENSEFLPHIPEQRLQSMNFYLPILFGNCLRNNILLRGAVSYGKCIINKSRNFFIGKPIVEAFELEKQQKWAGISLCDSAERLTLVEGTPRLERYDVPFEKETKNLLTLCWVDQCFEEIDWEKLFNSKNEDVIKKRENTKKYYEILTKNLFINRQ